MSEKEAGIIKQAEVYAVKKHAGQLDDTGAEYIVHPRQVAAILTLIGADESVIAAGFLHDVLEDTNTTYDELAEEFGNDIADLVNEVTKEGFKDSHGFYFPRLQTQRGIILKFADRLSNLSCMEAWDDKRIAHYLKTSKFWKSE